MCPLNHVSCSGETVQDQSAKPAYVIMHMTKQRVSLRAAHLYNSVDGRFDKNVRGAGDSVQHRQCAADHDTVLRVYARRQAKCGRLLYPQDTVLKSSVEAQPSTPQPRSFCAGLSHCRSHHMFSCCTSQATVAAMRSNGQCHGPSPRTCSPMSVPLVTSGSVPCAQPKYLRSPRLARQAKRSLRRGRRQQPRSPPRSLPFTSLLLERCCNDVWHLGSIADPTLWLGGGMSPNYRLIT